MNVAVLHVDGFQTWNHDWSKKWLQQNSSYVVKLITKGGFITASRSKELSLQLQYT